MVQNSKNISKLLRVLADVVEPMTPQQLEEFIRDMRRRRPISRKGEIQISATENNEVSVKRISPEEFLRLLRGSPDRSVAEALIGEYAFTKAELISIARMADVHLTKQDNMARIVQKIVETVVGSRLGSIAIRGDE